MTDETLNLDLKIQGKSDATQVSKDFENSRKSVEGLVGNINKLEAQLKRLTKEAQDFQAAMAGTTGGRSLGQSAKLIAGGSLSSVITNAQTAGRRADFKATETQTIASDVNTLFTGIRAAIAAAKNQTIVELAKIRQGVGANDDLATLKNKELAQLARVSAGQLQAATIPGGRVNPAEVTALNNIRAKIVEIEALQRKEVENAKMLAKADAERAKELAKQQAQQAKLANAPAEQATARANKLNTLFGDGGATLFKVQAGLLVNYAIMGQIFSLFQFGTQYVVQYDKALTDLQAVTVTTDANMKNLSKTFIDISQNTKFSAVEIAQAAVTLGQAGLSAKEIQDSIGSIALLATASGSDLATSVDVTTSALTVFNLSATETAHVADVMTGALNLSKLTMDKLALGIQYAGNTAAEAGTTLEELVSVLGGVSNAGIKSGSSIGTGVAQLFVELQTPTKKFLEQLKAVGLTIADVDVKSKGITGVLDTLAQAGFGASNAFAAFDLRAARAYLAASRNIDTIKDLNEQVQLSTAASAANEKQMGSLANTMAKLSNTFGATILAVGEPFKDAFITLGNGLSSIISSLNEAKGLLQIIGTVFLSVFGAGVIVKISSLILNLTGLTGLMQLLPGLGLRAAASFELMAVGEGVAATATGVLARALLFLSANPILGLAAIIGTVVGALGLFSAATGGAAEEIDKLQTKIDEQNGKYQEAETRIQSVDGEIGRLTDRYVELNSSSSDLQAEVVGLQTKFGAFTDNLKVDTIRTVEDLIVILRKLRGEMADLAREELQLLKQAEQNKLLVTGKSIKDEYGSSAFGRTVLGGSNQSKIVRNDVANTISNYSQSDIGNASLDQLQKNETLLIRQREKLISDELRLQKFRTESLKKQTEAGEIDAKLAQAEIDKTAKEKTAVEQLIVQAKTFTKIKRSETDDTINRTKAVTDLDDERQKAEQNLKEAEATLRGATTKKAKADSIAKQKEAQQVLKDLDAKSKSQDFINQVAQESGVDSSYVASNLKNGLTAQINEAVAQSTNTIKGATDSLGKGTKDYFARISELQKLSIEELKRQMNQATEAAQNAINVIEANIQQMTDTERGGLRGKYSDAEVSALQDKKNDIETARIRDRILIIEALKNKMAELVEQQKKVYEQAEAAHKADPSNGAKLSASIETLKDYNNAQDEQIKTTNELIELKAQLNARLGEETIAHMSLGDQIAYVINKYREQMGIQDSLGLNIQKNLGEAFDSAKGSLSDYFYAFVTGTQSAGNAFKNFAKSVLEDLARIAAKQAASGLFGLLLKGVGSIIGGSNIGPGYSAPIGPTPSGAPLPSTSLNFRDGGFVRAASGYGVPNRDSVPAMLMPGEFVLRKSAVDMIGKKNISQLNARGNAVISQSAGNIPNFNQMGDGHTTNVYVVSPEQKPVLTKDDVLVTISEDLARGGPTAKLVKTIKSGR